MTSLVCVPTRICVTPKCGRQFVSLDEGRCERCRDTLAAVALAARDAQAENWAEWNARRSEREAGG